MKDKTIRRVLIFFLIISAVLAGVAVETVRNINRSAASSDWVNHTHATILAVDGVMGAVHATDAALRTFVMTGNAQDRVACREALATAAENVEVAKAMTRADAGQHQQVLALEAAVAGRDAFTRQVLAARQANRSEEVQALLSGEGGESTKVIRRAVDGLKAEQMKLLAERDTASYRQAQTTRWTVWSAVGLDFVLLAGVAWLIRDDLTARHRLATTLQQSNQQLEEKVRERTRELASTNELLSSENLERRWANQALEHQLRYNQLIVNSINDSVIVLTKALNISRINPAVVQLTASEPDKLINQPLARWVQWAGDRQNSEPTLTDVIARSLREGRELRDQPAQVQARTGIITTVRLTVFPLRDHDKVVGGIVILQPIAAAA